MKQAQVSLTTQEFPEIWQASIIEALAQNQVLNQKLLVSLQRSNLLSFQSVRIRQN